ncbi:hypothetical protein L211DRAFT_840030 [Terfezia boudieri ATCC MYA-4762]|uniref:Uncharacterized protein n=1 Tax=Terfezia boudieri ATCC MYA-4762 TaxID=1051890 RepID=A0A3N4LK94_9PEZI|nr:hypothetical protein L211DRAFT_840030 [Terfezia boudieri ATCC MYA-4762]
MISSTGVMKRADRIDLGAGPEAMRKVVTAVVAILQQEAYVLEGIVQRKVSPPAGRVVSGEISEPINTGTDARGIRCITQKGNLSGLADV